MYYCSYLSGHLTDIWPIFTHLLALKLQHKYKQPHNSSVQCAESLVAGRFHFSCPDNGALACQQQIQVHTRKPHTRSQMYAQFQSNVSVFPCAAGLPGADRALSYTPSAQPVPILHWYYQHFQLGASRCQSSLSTHTRTHRICTWAPFQKGPIIQIPQQFNYVHSL